jgi:uncharacterized membrane protein YqaE (UPF0057 family)
MLRKVCSSAPSRFLATFGSDQRNKRYGQWTALGAPVWPASPGLVKPDTRRYLMDLLRIIVAILLPPLGVFLQVGIGKQFWINVLLTILGYIPGIIHAVWVIAKY